MKTIWVLLCACLLVCGCATRADSARAFGLGMKLADEANVVFSYFNRQKGSVCMGISGPYTSRARAVRAATENSLKYIALYKGMAMQSEFGSLTNEQRGLDYFESSSFGGAPQKLYDRAAGELEIQEALWYGDKVGAVVFSRVQGMEALNWDLDSDWTSNPPVIEGYVTAAATSQKRYSSLKRAVEAACFNAAKKLLELGEGSLTVVSDFALTRAGNYENDLYSIVGNRFEGFRILALRYDEKEGKVYALAAAKK